MNASVLYVLRNLRRRRARTVIGAAGLFLTLALLTAIQIGIDSVSTSYIDLVALQAGKADVVITRRGAGPFNPLSFDAAEVTKQLEDHAQLRGLSPRLFGMVQLGTADSTGATAVLGLDPQRERELDLWGLQPVPTLQANACAVSHALAQKLGIKPGARLTLRSAANPSGESLTLESVIQRQLVLPQEIREFVVVNETLARSLLGLPSGVHSLAGCFRDSRALYDARDLHASVLRLKDAGEALAASLDLDYEVRLPKAAAITSFQHFTAPVRAVFGVFALLALAITGLLIYSLVSVSVEERIREYAILRTLGAKSREIFRLVLGESFLLCLLGVLPGAFGGALLAKLVVTIASLALKSKEAAITAEITPAALWLPLAAGIALSLGSALVPALHATRWRIVDALDPLRRGQLPTQLPREGGANRNLLLAGLALAAVSVVVFFVLPSAFLSGNPSLIGTVVLSLLLAILLGFTLVITAVLPVIERALLGIGGWYLGPIAELAGRNLERHRRRHTTTSLLFTLSVALVIFLASLAALFSRTSLALVEKSHGADLRLQASGRADATPLRAEIAKTTGVGTLSEVQFLRSRSQTGIAYDVVISDLVGLKHLWIVPFGADASLSQALYTDRIVATSGSEAALSDLHARIVDPSARQTVPGQTPAVILSQAAAAYLDVSPGDQVALAFHLGAERAEARFRVAAVFGSLPGFDAFRSRVASATGSGVLLSLDNFRVMTRAAPPEAFQSLFFIRAAGASPTAQKSLARDLRAGLDARHRLGVKSTAEQKEQIQALYWVTQIFFGLMLGVAVIIAVFALIASMSATVLERRWEIGVLKALGLRRDQLFRIFLAEAVVLTLSAGIAGGVIGFSLAWLFLLQASVLLEMELVFALPYLTFLGTFAVSLFAGALAAHLPTRHLLRKTAAEILRL